MELSPCKQQLSVDFLAADSTALSGVAECLAAVLVVLTVALCAVFTTIFHMPL
jgi:hypothetical protein